MPIKSRNRSDRKFSILKRLSAALILAALVSAVLPLSVFSAARKRDENLVYCPLSKKLQPVKLPEVKTDKNPFDSLCASDATKNLLFHEIILNSQGKTLKLSEISFETLVFDFIDHGRAAFDKLPFAPHSPSNNLSERISVNSVSTSRDEHRFGWIYAAAIHNFSPNLKPRPPTVQTHISTAVPNFRAALLSRRLAPRAPPALS